MHAELYAFLRASGATDEEIERAAEQGWLPLLAIDAYLMPGEAEHDLAGAARAAGVDEEFARRLWRAMGFPDPPDGAKVFTDRDVQALRLVAHRLRPEDDRAQFFRQVRAIGTSMSRLGAINADLIAAALQELRRSGMDDETIAAVLPFGIDWPSVEFLIDYVHRVQTRAAVWRRLALEEFEDVGAGIGVGFADLAGYTELSAELDPDRLEQLLTRWEELSADLVAQHGGRVVKTIGDEVMFVGLAESVARIARAIRDGARADAVLPEVRIGLASGTAIARDGDYFGPVVNLASRLADLAAAGEVLASADMKDAAAPATELAWTAAGHRYVRGIGDVEVWVLG